MAAKLKVFSWSDGFHAFTVAASSRSKALAAWGMSQDIFKSGLAREVTEGAAYDAALKSPGEVIQTGEAVEVGAIEAAPKPRRPSGPSAAQKKRIAGLEKALADLDEAQSAALDAVDQEIMALQTRRASLEADHVQERRALAAKLKAARSKA